MLLSLPSIPLDQALRYLGVGGRSPVGQPPGDVLDQVKQACAQLLPVCQPRYVWREAQLEEKGMPVLEPWGLRLPGEDMPTLLRDCRRCVIFALTLGDGPEGLMRRAAPVSPGKALILDACASAACEAACDLLQAQLESQLCAEEGPYPTDRFSPGYGDLPLSVQPQLLELLDAQRQCGLTLNESWIMTPRKSVTAIFGLADKPQGKRKQGCGACSMGRNCSYRKAGITCG